MYLFIDESGDTGTIRSPTRYFVIAVIIFDDTGNMNSISNAIEDFKNKEKINGELHFCKTPNNIKDKFFYFINKFNFKAKSICVNKDELRSEFLIKNPEKLYNYMLKLLLDNLNNEKHFNIIIDGKGNKVLERQLKSYLKTNTKLKVKNIKAKDSRSETLLQLADMVASAIGYSYNKNKENKSKWKNIISDKIDIWNFR
ncbi:MAG: DUF3800 domain-containing protein [Rickettsiales bacterium]|nr:DUF3800 domain-containing protein [Rickettsiales bacterium]